MIETLLPLAERLQPLKKRADNQGDGGEKVATSERKVATLQDSKVATLAELPPQRMSVKKMENIIMRICKDNYVKKRRACRTIKPFGKLYQK